MVYIQFKSSVRKDRIHRWIEEVCIVQERERPKERPLFLCREERIESSK